MNSISEQTSIELQQDNTKSNGTSVELQDSTFNYSSSK